MRILIIEDDHASQLLFRELISGLGITVDVATTGYEGIGKAVTLRPDLILLDMRLPDMTGSEINAILKRSTPTGWIPVVGITAERGKVFPGMWAGFMAKPIDVEKFTEYFQGLKDKEDAKRRAAEGN